MANITSEQLERITAMDYETKMRWVDLYLLGSSITRHTHKGKEYTAFYWCQSSGSDACIDDNNLIYVAMRQAVRAIGHRILHRSISVGDRFQIEFMTIGFDMPYDDWEMMKHIYELYSNGSLDDFTEEEHTGLVEDESDDEDDDNASHNTSTCDDEDGEVSTQSMTHTVEEEVSDDPSQ